MSQFEHIQEQLSLGADYETVAHKKQKKALALVSAPCFFVSGMQSCLHYRQQSRTDQK